MSLFLYYFMLFFIYSIIGWAVESVYVSCQENKLVNRGFLIGPYCPIYGFGCLLMVLYLGQYKDNIVTVFLLGLVICSVLEYFTSYIMEVLFKTRWWDYSDRKFNLNGRVCGWNALLFGIGGLIIVYLLHPMLLHILIECNKTALLIISICCFIVFVTDLIFSLNIVNRFKKTVTDLDLKKDSTQEFSDMVREALLRNHRTFQKRLYTAFPNLDLKPLLTLRDEIKEEIQEFLDKKKDRK